MTNVVQYWITVVLAGCIIIGCSDKGNMNGNSSESAKDSLEMKYNNYADMIKKDSDYFYGKSPEFDAVLDDMTSMSLNEFKSTHDLSDNDISVLIQSLDISQQLRTATKMLNDKMERINSEMEESTRQIQASLDSLNSFSSSSFNRLPEDIDTIAIHGSQLDSATLIQLKQQFPNSVIEIIE